MEHGQDPNSSISALAEGMLRGDAIEAWRLFANAWIVLERFVRVRLITGRLPGRLLEDCGQEIFTRVWRFRERYQGHSEGEFWAWLRRICDNERRRILSREARRSGSKHIGGEPPAEASEALVTPDIAQEKVTLDEELAALHACTQSLDEVRRRVIELVYYEPTLTERAAAELIGMSPANVHKLKTEALRLLEQCLRRKGIE